MASLTHLTTPGIGYIGYHLFVEQVLRPTLRQRAVVIVDNRRAHKAVGSREAMAQTLATSPILDARGWFQHCGDAFQ
ncbi:MAG TPA: hypothetical protein VLK82_09400 [Candidatus Tectomicrobia bacterium]|nr:hypothetical protein [Candidatus Tectomicrobia bacterium]